MNENSERDDRRQADPTSVAGGGTPSDTRRQLCED